jgi:hypothetical protein
LTEEWPVRPGVEEIPDPLFRCSPLVREPSDVFQVEKSCDLQTESLDGRDEAFREESLASGFASRGPYDPRAPLPRKTGRRPVPTPDHTAHWYREQVSWCEITAAPIKDMGFRLNLL